MDAVQRRGSAARMNYINRFVSVLLCMVVCAGLMPPPRARAVAAGITMAVGGAVAAAPIESVLGAMILAGLGITINQPPIASGDGYVFGSGAYDVGSLLRSAVWTAGGAVKAWFEQKVAEIQAAGGFIVNQGIVVPVEVAEFARQWAVETYDFSGGEVVINQNGIFSSTGQFLLSTVPSPLSGERPPLSLGTVLHPVAPSGTVLTLANGVSLLCTVETVTSSSRFDYVVTFRFPSIPDFSKGYFCTSENLASSGFVFRILNDEFCLGFYSAGIVSISGYGIPLSLLSGVVGLPSTMTKEPSLDLPREEDLPLVVPDVFIGKVGEIDVPITDVWSKDVVIAGEVVEPTAPPVPTTAPGEVTDAMVGDIAISGIATAGQDVGLRNMFITKFPFSIPWDLYNAVQLLAAPPKTPYWEVDFMAPIAHRVGGFAGDTTIVLDFSDYEILGQLCRWVTTIMFVSSLAMGTKRLMWTA